MAGSGEEQRALFRRWPAGVAVVVAEAEGRRAGLTVSSLVSVSLDPPLVSIALARTASLYEVLRDAGSFGVSLLAADQVRLARHFSQNVPPIAHWEQVELQESDARLLAGAAGWITCTTVETVRAGDHAIFVGAVESLALGSGAGALVYLDRRFLPL